VVRWTRRRYLNDRTTQLLGMCYLKPEAVNVAGAQAAGQRITAADGMRTSQRVLTAVVATAVGVRGCGGFSLCFIDMNRFLYLRDVDNPRRVMLVGQIRWPDSECTHDIPIAVGL
jgi:hypothetical protein